MELFVRKCVAMELQGFIPQHLANTINGEAGCMSFSISELRADDSCAGFAKLGHQPGPEFMKLFVRKCEDMDFKDFEPQVLSNVINGEMVLRYGSSLLPPDRELLFTQALRSSSTSPRMPF
jgi:hypothetical protein